MTAAEIVPVETAAPIDPGSAEGIAWFDATMRQAEVLAASQIVPTQYQGKPADIVVAAMYGRDFGWSPTLAMQSIHVVEGNPTLSAQAMVALVRGAGHSITGDSDNQGARLTGRRADTGDQLTVEFSVWDAERAGLCTVNEDGSTRARSQYGKPKPWELYPQSMCWARAVSQLCRMLFADVLMGVSYTPEELDGLPAAPGVEPSFGGDGPAAATPTLDWDALRSALGAKVARLNRNHHECWEAWKADHEGWFNDLGLLGEADAEVVRMLQAQGVDPFLDDIEDAEIVTDGDQLGESDGRAGDAGQVDGEGSSRTPVESLPAPPVLTTDGGGGTQEGVAREVEAGASDPAPDLAPQGDGAGSPNPVTQARTKAKDA